MERLYKKLKEYSQTDMYGFHMPGHKRKPLLHHCYEIDITEIDGFDDMHHPEGLLKEFQSYMKEIYHTKGSYFLVNGSTGGILAAISGAVELGGELLAARNCHKSVYNVAFLRNLKTHYLYPQYDENWGCFTHISPEDVEKSMEKYPSCKAVMIVSPTYEGVVSDVAAIAEVVHRHGGILIVDEAHGAHFPYLEDFPKSAVDCGADIVIQSVHKTLPALTQTALLHVCGSDALQKKVEQYLSIYQSSSPSYVFLSSIEECVLWMEEHKNTIGKAYSRDLKRLRQQIAGLQQIELYQPKAQENIQHPDENTANKDRVCRSVENTYMTDKNVKNTDQAGEIQKNPYKHFCPYDQGKLVLRVRNMENSGKWLYEQLLEEHHIQLEMSLPGYCIAMTSIMDSQEGFERLFHALYTLDQSIVADQAARKNAFHAVVNQGSAVHQHNADCNKKAADDQVTAVHERENCSSSKADIPLRQALENEFVYTAYEAGQLPSEAIPLIQCEGRISQETAYVYPPGIPIIVAGERFSGTCVQVLQQYCQYGFEIRGIQNSQDTGKIRVCKESEIGL